VKEFLSQAGHTFTVRVVDNDDKAYDDLVAMGFRSVPVTVIGTQAIRGFDAAALTKALEGGG